MKEQLEKKCKIKKCKRNAIIKGYCAYCFCELLEIAHKKAARSKLRFKD